ncbi:MAG TPA: hybrid sensor histidine kinase/response regulator [Azospirillum sp.]|nr:hybrid sensor histidine kinase/response regulator [Azospirillum sp.]
MDLSAEHEKLSPCGAERIWPESLRNALRVCRLSAGPAVLFTGTACAVHFNEAFRRLLGDGGAPQGLPASRLLGREGEALVRRLDRLRAGDGEADEEGLVLRLAPAGALHCPVDLRCAPVVDGGAVVGVFAFATPADADCERVEDCAHVRAATVDEAGRGNAAKARFLAAASHDLRQPFQAMRLFLGVLDQQVSDPAASTTVARLGEALEAGERLLHALLDISIIDSGQIEPKVTDFALDVLLRQLVEENQPQAAAKGLRLKARLFPARGRTDPVLLERIVRNLLSNAIRYTRTGTVLVAMRRRGNAVRVEVWDTGFGIPDGQVAAIFEEFHQLENPERDRARGFGLGLSIVRRLATLLGMPVGLRSQLGRGSVFAVTVPLGAAPTPAERGHAGADEAGDGLHGITVLVVDDDEMVLFGLRMMLEAWECSVVPAADLREVMAGLDALPAPPDVILTDLRLPGGANGYDVIQRVRRLYRREIPAVVLTGEASQSPLADGGLPGCGLMRKPVQPDELRRVLLKALEKE